MTIESALLELGLFRDTTQPPPGHRMLEQLDIDPVERDHGYCPFCARRRRAAA